MHIHIQKHTHSLQNTVHTYTHTHPHIYIHTHTHTLSLFSFLSLPFHSTVFILLFLSPTHPPHIQSPVRLPPSHAHAYIHTHTHTHTHLLTTHFSFFFLSYVMWDSYTGQGSSCG